jgi:hypothetical protein
MTTVKLEAFSEAEGQVLLEIQIWRDDSRRQAE